MTFIIPHRKVICFQIEIEKRKNNFKNKKVVSLYDNIVLEDRVRDRPK